MTKGLTIKQVSVKTGLCAHTLRYYERIGLIDPVPRQSKQRVYQERDVEWIDFLLKIKSTGLPIKQMVRYAELRRQGNSQQSLSERKAILEQHVLYVEQSLVELQTNLEILHCKVALYENMQAQLDAK